MSSNDIPEGPGSVSGAPNLPEGFTDTFRSRYVRAGDQRLHVVIGGEGPPLLMVHGWPQTWYQYRLLMPTLAREYEVIVPDQRGIGLSAKPEDGYDTATLANDLITLMDALDHERFAYVGCDTGMLIGYALAGDHPDRVLRAVLGEAPLPGVSPPLPLIIPGLVNERLWHIAFNALPKVNEELVVGREDIFFGAEYVASAGKNKLPDDVVAYYVDRLRTTEALHGTFQLYRALTASVAQNEQRKAQRLPMPVLALGGAESLGEMIVDSLRLTADDVEGVVLPAGHWLAEQAPDEMLAAITSFLKPYRDEMTSE